MLEDHPPAILFLIDESITRRNGDCLSVLFKTEGINTAHQRILVIQNLNFFLIHSGG